MATKAQLAELSQFGTATIHEAIGKIGNLPYQIKPINKNMRICGPAYTVKAKAYMNVNLHRAVANANPGDVIIANCSEAYEAGYWGDLLTSGAMKQGMINEPITIGEITVNPGDIIVGDRDGVVVIPKDMVEEAILKSYAREQKEARVRARLNEGETSLQIYGWDKKFGY